jgi:hypothetical protein
MNIEHPLPQAIIAVKGKAVPVGATTPRYQ